MSEIGYDSIINGRTNKYESSFFHIYLKGESPITNTGTKDVSKRDYASFVHEYIHYIQDITTPYGIKYSKYFTYHLILFREFIYSNTTLTTPVKLEEAIRAAKDFEAELNDKNGSKNFSQGTISDIEIKPADIASAKINNSAVNIGVYDFVNDRVFEEGFKFGYRCIIESMAHLVQLLINPDLQHAEVPYKSAQLICDKLRPDLINNKKLLISICYTSLFFDNPGHSFFEIIESVKSDDSGVELFERYMQDYSRTFNGEEMPNYRMMHKLMDDFIYNLNALLGNDSVYMKDVIENCKLESSSGKSLLLRFIYNEDLSKIEHFNDLLDFYGIPAIDSANGEVVIPFNPATHRPYVETASLLSLELIAARLSEKEGKQCIRYTICDRESRVDGRDLIDEHCANLQWNKQLPCIFTSGLLYWRMSNKTFE